jgi:hypothetical protein
MKKSHKPKKPLRHHVAAKAARLAAKMAGVAPEEVAKELLPVELCDERFEVGGGFEARCHRPKGHEGEHLNSDHPSWRPTERIAEIGTLAAEQTRQYEQSPIDEPVEHRYPEDEEPRETGVWFLIGLLVAALLTYCLWVGISRAKRLTEAPEPTATATEYSSPNIIVTPPGVPITINPEPTAIPKRPTALPTVDAEDYQKDDDGD